MVAKDIEQAAFESWLETTSPSGDVEEVHSKWLNSSVFASLKAFDDEPGTILDNLTIIPGRHP